MVSAELIEAANVNRILKDVTFVRIYLDSVYMNDLNNECIDVLIKSRSLFGFVLEYEFPSLDYVSTSLKARVRINAKSFNSNAIHFRHRRVVRVKMHPNIVNCWTNRSLQMTIYARLNTLGKYSIKLLGRCTLHLDQLVRPPFVICRHLTFEGPGFCGTALIRIDLGSHIKSLMEYLEMMRDGDRMIEEEERLRRTSANRSRSRTRSKSESRWHGSGSERSRSESESYSRPCSRNGYVSSRPSSLTRQQRVPFKSLTHQQDKPRHSSSSPFNDISSSNQPSSINNRPLISPPPIQMSSPHLSPKLTDNPNTYRIILTVHSARRLPIFYAPRGEAVAPSTYVTVNGADGRMLSSSVRASTLRPEWNWTESFDVPKDRRNLIVKLWRKSVTGSDRVIGFVSIPLPPSKSITENEYEMSDLGVAEQTPLITMSIMKCDDNEMSNEKMFETSSQMALPIPSGRRPLLCRSPSPTIDRMSREEISERLRKNLSELEMMMAELRYSQ
ncbi:unnamed protein product [Anisakis simplex]|uniref:C2 domain-containing protein n=1 Tax=Anisakis simplex TaxID=6269 RepID=A0A0M3K8F3_ANISI|nr:unnamed protein product [Anisakis simplex]